MAHKKAGGSTSLGRDSQAKRLGVKRFDGQPVKAGMVLVRQRGSKYRAGESVRKGGDDTLFAIAPGVVKVTQKQVKHFDGNTKLVKFMNVRQPEAKK